MKYKTSYTTIYNFRPGELYGMGKESLTVTGVTEDLVKWFGYISHNSSLKHENAIEHAYGLDECWEREDWKPWIGQPMFYVVDIKWEPV
jgi:hypothetical protein